MKKILVSLIAIVGLLSSCTNDDIKIANEIAFTINPSTVVENLAEVEPGELTVLPNGLSLRVQLFVYNKEGLLVAYDSKDMPDYSHLVTSTQNLPEGEYVILTSTHITDGTDKYAWIVSSKENINSLTIKEDGIIRQQYGILGLSSQKITVTKKTKDIRLDVQLAGAVAIVRYRNYNTRGDLVNAYSLISNKNAEAIHLDTNGEIQYSYNSKNDYAYRLSRVEPEPNYSHARRYIFMFPMKDVKLSFAAEVGTDKDYKTIPLGQECLDDIIAGREYYFVFDAETLTSTWEFFNPSEAPMKATAESQDCNVSLPNLGNMKSDFEGLCDYKSVANLKR